jgi:ankyrin repeat protein
MPWLLDLTVRLVKAPLDEAAWRGRKDIVQLLITKGADVDAKMMEGGKNEKPFSSLDKYFCLTFGLLT